MADRTHVNGTSNGLPNGVHNETVNGAADGLANGVEEPSKRGFIGAIDQGTTSTRFIIFEVATGEPVAKHQLEIENHHPHPGWHEHDPKELLHSVTTCMEAAFADFVELGHTKDDLRAIGITNQRETTIVWDGRTGETLHNAIVWSDTRTADKARQINEQATSKTISDLTGLPVWEDGHLMFGTVDTWLVYCLNGGSKAKEPVHVTDSTNASRTMLMNLRTLHWEDSIIQTFGLDKHPLGLPRIVSSSDPNAFGSIFSGPLEGVRITGCLGDQSAALVGQCAFAPGQAKNTYGTGCFLLYNVGKERPDLRGSGSGLISTVAYDFATTGEFRQATYALEGSIATAGSGVKFLVKNLGLGNDAHDINALANSVPNSGGVVFVTAFSGLLAPYWIDDARGTLFGLTQFTQKGHIARATLDATCYQAKAILDAMAKQSGSHLDSLAVDGGLSNSDLCMQSQADISGIPIDRLCRRRGWQDPTYECYRDPSGFTCLVLVNGREYQTDLAYQSDVLAQENAAMRAFMVCRNFSVNGGMLARNGIVQGLPATEAPRRSSKKSRHMASSQPGSGVKFLVKNLGLGNDAHDINALANSVPDSGGVVFVTAFSGLLAPYWIDDARGTLFGLTQFTQKGHIARATLDATCYQAKAILDAMAKQSGSHLNSLAVDGGLSNSDLCMQSQADISGIPIDRPAMHEITALGAAYAAGLGIGAWTMDELIAMNARQQGTRRFEPNSEKKAECERMYRKWGQAVHMSRGWATDEDATASSNDEQSASSSEEEDAPFDLEHMN
ncbi:hypothetical protein BN1708_003253 [Verticillium longisporum]|uniref:glycerol kinase n=1 Tax=Verticillium longisporum TaxID=100787 RepID=A0A0G4LD93_VERLO|nr:hypothetical protein BN1708_003253 [Verticillium longisporum]